MMELARVKAGIYEFRYNPLTIEVFLEQTGEEWEIEIYKLKHFQGSLEIDKDGKMWMVEDLHLQLEQVEPNVIEVN